MAQRPIHTPHKRTSFVIKTSRSGQPRLLKSSIISSITTIKSAKLQSILQGNDILHREPVLVVVGVVYLTFFLSYFGLGMLTQRTHPSNLRP
eukprot:5708808-Ditylum_brightwellii.AAC.1